MNQTERSEPGFATICRMPNKRVFSITLIIFINILGAGMVLPVLPLYAEGTFGASIFQATLLATAYFGAQAVAAPILGRLSDRLGRRPVLIGSQIGTVSAFVLFYFAGEIGARLDMLNLPLGVTGGLIMLYVARILDGLTGGNITTAQAYITDVTKPAERAENLGLIQAAFGVGFIFGPALGGLLGNYGPRIPFIGAAIITTGTLLLTTFTLDESLTAERRATKTPGEMTMVPVKVLLRNRGFLLLMAVNVLSTMAFSAVRSTFSLYADIVLFPTLDETEVIRNVGFMLAFMGASRALTQIFTIRPLIRWLGERMLLIVGAAVMTAGILFSGFAASAMLVTLLQAPFSFGRGVSEPSLQSLVTGFGNERVQGQLLGVNQSARSMGLILGPLLAGLVFQTISPQSAWYYGAICGGLSVVIAVLYQRETPVTQTVLRRAQPIK